MPRTKLDRRPSKLFILLNGAAKGKTNAELGVIIGKKAQTTGYRLADPDTLTIGELKRLCRNLHIPIEDLRSAIEY